MSIRRTPSDPEIEACLDFTPVPRLCNRIDGWTPARQRGFIEALARLGTVKAAAGAVAMSPEGAYYLRRQRGAEAFARAWARAHAAGVASLRDIAYERAVHGTPKGVWHKGERVGEERRYNDRLLMFMLRHEAPALYGKPKRLGGGTRHPDTVQREAAWAIEGDAALWTDPADEQGAAAEAKLAAIERVIALYRIKIATERRDRLAGNVVGADFALRQATIMEVLLSAGPGARALLADTDPRYDPDSASNAAITYVTPMSRAIAAERQKIWDAEAAPLRPGLRERMGESGHIRVGPTWPERTHAQTEAKAIMARGQAMWEAAATEEGWVAWNKGRS